MRIEGIAAKTGSKVVSNKDILETIEEHSTSFEGDLPKTLRVIEKLLKKSGSNERRWLAKTEKPIELLDEAVDEALTMANLKRDDIDLLIYVGVGRGFLEPAASYLVAQALGMYQVECFDIIDACMSWSRGLQMADALFKVKQYRHILVVNCECNMYEDGSVYPGNFKLKSLSELHHLLPSYTIGEACTATVLTAADEGNFSFCFESKPKHADLCTVTAPHYEGYCASSKNIAINGIGKFTSFGQELHERLEEGIHTVFENLAMPRDEIDKVFTHASSSTKWHRCAKREGIEDKVFHIYPDTGNLVSASVPTAISKAINSGAVKSGQSILGWVGSAGMSFSAYNFKL